jgi:prepilin-type N-terminal cleavage/methylation domain-containing protein
MRMMFRTKERGFTLIEAIITVTIIAIFAVMALPRLNSTRMQVRSVSRQIMGDMRYARTLAVTEAKNVTVTFTNTQYVIDGITKILPNNVQCTTASFTFQKRGNTTAGGSLTVSKNGHSSTISITASTGMVKNEG